MLCDKCGQNEATVKFVQIENNKKTELHLCRDCAQGYTSFSPGFDLQQLLSSLFQSLSLGQKTAPAVAAKKCPTCGRTLGDIQQTGRLGCSSCYEVFREELSPVLRRLHGSGSHTGKVPARAFPRVHATRQMEELRKRLDECVRLEKYEEAARLRDELRLLEKELAGGEAR
ncbi:MAG: UvrB/UvrC motif-containing protein [Limnochordia bacterium]|jgi:protein arginine kinase activator|nr:UvrB/UvrC motif-containing protein [Limnochordia bacterium]MDI9465907.1 UvrB/UvrC motif-containing protein [Bacillota bacterium]NLO96192.1 hypothetical protein [Bacillota bacterium]HAI51996.1 hypothetical protein [Bacillota bacterium]HAN94454.1 hypothetical protein [Bacillota bacterium]